MSYATHSRPLPEVDPTIAPLHRRRVHYAGIALVRLPLTLAVFAFVVGLVALVALPGADSLWLVAFGRAIGHGSHSATSVPYAAAPTHSWANVPALAELAFAGVNRLAGTRGLVAAQVVAVVVGFASLAATMRRQGGSDAGVAIALLLVTAGSVPELVVVRAQLFSLLLFPVLLALLFSETRRPTRGVWLLLPLLALWSSLHGAVLAGAAVAGVWLVFQRLRRSPREALLILALLPVAICATPALQRSPTYYADVLGSEAVRRGYGLWAPLQLTVVDVLLVTAGILLAFYARRSKPVLWELVGVASLGVLTIQSPRAGVWLLMLLGVLAARGIRMDGVCVRPRVAGVGCLIATFLLVIGLSSAPSRAGGDRAVIGRAVLLSRSTPILAEPFLAEKVAAGGGRVWIANPIDAFDKQAQSEWLDWLQGRPGGTRLLYRVGGLVLVRAGSLTDSQLRLTGRYDRLVGGGGAILYRRR